MAPAVRRATYQDVLDAPAHMIAEIIDGQLHLHPRPARRHTGVHTRLLLSFGSGLQGDGPSGWVVLLEPELHLGEDIVVPDVAAWRSERFDFENEEGAFYTIAPDWCCEILSPATRRRDRIDKSRIYAEHHVGYFWLVDPLENEIEAFARLPNGHWELLGVFAGDETVRIAPFEVMLLQLARLWGQAHG